MAASTGKIFLPEKSSIWNDCLFYCTGLPSTGELHQSSKTIEKLATPNEFHRVREKDND